jgi:lysozyme
MRLTNPRAVSPTRHSLKVVSKPSKRPSYTREQAKALLSDFNLSKEPVVILGFRGYYLDSVGEKGKNDRGVYDDAIIITSDKCHSTYNANTDPSLYKSGIASLVPGKYSYKLGVHGLSKPKPQRYEALVQAEPVIVARDDGQTEEGWFGINIHKGYNTTTGSAGCQTIAPDQWKAFIETIKQQLVFYKRKVVTYLLLDKQG